MLGIALQGEHAMPPTRAARQCWRCSTAARCAWPIRCPAPRPRCTATAATSHADGRFAVSCPRAQGVALWSATGAAAGFFALPEACPLASSGMDGPFDAAGGPNMQRNLHRAIATGTGPVWAGGRHDGLALRSGADDMPRQGETGQAAGTVPLPPDVQLDNHWLVLDA